MIKICTTLLLTVFASFAWSQQKPNIIFIMADDQGYSEASCYYPESKIKTPGIDRIAAEGMRFTDAHSSSAVCTPTRYGLLTGRYSWRTKLQEGVLSAGAPCLIANEILTVPELLKEAGYHTALIGKWHLGYQYDMPEGTKITKVKESYKRHDGTVNKTTRGEAPRGSKVINGPLAHGFDVFKGFHYAREMRSWTEQDEVIENLDTIHMLPRLAKSSVEYIEERSKEKETPFFMYVALGSPHTPIVASNEWYEKIGHEYFAFVEQSDDAVVQILNALDRTGLTEKTLVFFTADNGTSKAAGLEDLKKNGHDVHFLLRGSKADVWDGGHRVPYVVRWPGVIKPGSVSNELICHNNFIATCADILDITLPENAGVDSFSILSVLKGETSNGSTHPYVVHHSVSGGFAIREGDWKFIFGTNSMGWTKGGDDKPSQLYNMAEDIAEQNNLSDTMPEKVSHLTALMEKSIADGRSTPGLQMKNDVPIELWKKQGKDKGKKKKK
ncbi:MAG: arylsulfatase [Verrucomicrobiota bacterium]